MKKIKKRIIIILCAISVLIGSFAVPLKAKAVVGVAVASYTLAELLTYVISGVLAVGATVGLNEVLNNEEEMYNLINHYLSDSSGIVIDESKRTVVKDEQEITIQEWIDNINNKYGAQMADQGGNDIWDELLDIDIQLQHNLDAMHLVDMYVLNESDQEALGTDKVYITEEEFQELLYALYLKNHGLLDEQVEEDSSTSGDDENNDDKHKLDWKTLAVTTASVPVAALGVGGKTFWENVSNFFSELFNDEAAIDDYPSLSSLYNFDTPYYDGTLDVDISGNYTVTFSGYYEFTSTSYGTCSQEVTGSFISGTGKPFALFGNGTYFLCCVSDSTSSGYANIDFQGTRIYTKRLGTSSESSSSYSIDGSIHPTGAPTTQWLSINVPVFNSIADAQAYIESGDDSACINKEQPKFTYNHVLDNTGVLSTSLKPLTGISSTQGLSSISLYNYAQDILDNQDTLKSDPDEYTTLILPKIDTLANSAEDVAFTIVSDDDSEAGTDSDNETESKPTYGNDISDSEDFEVVTNPDPISLPLILPFTIPSVAQKVKGTSDWEYNYSPFFIAIISMLMIDVETVKTHAMESLDKLPPLNGTQAIFDSINIIADSINDEIIYPVISIDTPDILYQFYPYSEIVLCDTADYARFFSFVRSALSVSLAIGFVMWLLRQLKITLSIN